MLNTPLHLGHPFQNKKLMPSSKYWSNQVNYWQDKYAENLKRICTTTLKTKHAIALMNGTVALILPLKPSTLKLAMMDCDFALFLLQQVVLSPPAQILCLRCSLIHKISCRTNSRFNAEYKAFICVHLATWIWIRLGAGSRKRIVGHWRSCQALAQCIKDVPQVPIGSLVLLHCQANKIKTTGGGGEQWLRIIRSLGIRCGP